MVHLTTAFRERGLPIVHVVRLYRPDGSNADPVRRHAIQQGRRLLAPGSTGSQIAPELLPKAVALEPELLLGGGFQQLGTHEHIMYKPRRGAFLPDSARTASARERKRHSGSRRLQLPGF